MRVGCVVVVSALMLIGCASSGARKSISTNVVSAKCESTPVRIGDLEKFGFTPAPGKVVVVRLFRVSCPFCKEDLLRIGSFFENKTWTKENVQLFLIAYRKEGVEDRKTFDAFMREEMNQLGIPLEAAQVIYIDKDYYTLVNSKTQKGDLIFEGWKAVPFGLVFAKDGRLAYRGHFTTSPGTEDEHYKFISSLQTETCVGGGQALRVELPGVPGALALSSSSELR